MKHGYELAVLLVASTAIATAHAASAVQAGESADRKDAVTAPGYAFRANISDYYPSASRALGEQGAARVRACYDIKGKIHSTEIDESSGFKRLDEAALRASSDFVIKPGTLSGKPQEGCVVLPIRFSLMGPGVHPAPSGGQQDTATSTELTYMPDIRGYYPSESRKAGEEGTVVVLVCYSAKGKNLSTKVDSSSGFERLDEAAVRAGRKIRLKPAELDGVPQAGCGVVPIKFSRNSR